MKKQVMQLQDYQEHKITVVGVPQFDYYYDRSRLESRENFCRRLGLDPDKKILCLGSEGKVMPSDAAIAEILYDLVRSRALHEECQILIRPHFGYKNDEQKFISLHNKPGVVIDSHNQPSQGFRDHWDYSKEHMDNFLNIVYHSDIMMSTASTLSLDAAALARPSILVMFDGYEKKPFHASGARWYVCDYFNEFMRYHAALVADNADALKESINKLLREPKLLEHNQLRLCERFCYRLDGCSGKRLFETLEVKQ